eukprot:scaffold3782_cov75-Phaeocystis_antarctica.AAC.2
MGGESVPAGMVRIGRTRGSQAWWALCASRADAPRWRGCVRAAHLVGEVRRPTRKGWRSNELGSGRPRRRCRTGPCAVRPAAKPIGCAAPIEETQRRSPLIDDNSFATWAYRSGLVWLDSTSARNFRRSGESKAALCLNGSSRPCARAVGEYAAVDRVREHNARSDEQVPELVIAEGAGPQLGCLVRVHL